MRSEDKVGVDFVNTVIGRGVLNGVINLSFSTFNFTPNDEGQVDLDPAVTVRLRMDRVCALQLRDVMNDLLTSIEKAEHENTTGKELPVEGVLAKNSETLN